MNYLYFILLCLHVSTCLAVETKKEWSLGGDLSVCFTSDVKFEFSEKDKISLSAHLPGFQEKPGPPPYDLVLNHRYHNETYVDQGIKTTTILSSWNRTLPPDFIHVLYGLARQQWLNHEIYPVHAACIGNQEKGYILLVGSPGSGKTSLSLSAILDHDYQLFSGDKTLLKITGERLEAVSGTRTVTVRLEDVKRWSKIPKIHEYRFGDRIAFQLPKKYQAQEASVSIKAIFLVGLNDGAHVFTALSPLSALHTLYPFFLDKQREDVLIGENVAFIDGEINPLVRQKLAQDLSKVLQKIPVFKANGSLEEVISFVETQIGFDIKEKQTKKILYGICGIGNGHINRQMPIIRHLLSEGHQIMVLTYGNGLTYFQNFPEITVIPVKNPYYVGSPTGLDFKTTASHPNNEGNITRVNLEALSQIETLFNIPDLVISDYEMISAQYAYAKQVPLVTLDQQSKYLVGKFDKNLQGTSYVDEVERLNMFFPKAAKRFAISFFRVNAQSSEVEILPPIIRPKILAAKGKPLHPTPSILVYITSQLIEIEIIDEWVEILKTSLPDTYEANIFIPRKFNLPKDNERIHFFHHGDSRFDQCLISAHGVISTAGHTLLSEAMYLEKPVYAIPLPLYEQQLNAHVIAEGGFGICEKNLTKEGLVQFLDYLPDYKENIQKDETFLFKEPGNEITIQKIMKFLK
ncbi:MAG: hypothetical protein K940chlam3_01049 [Chlamydiae bacterium]|nr:hypothetical protein [Chlamydiota bacterium]